MDQGSLRDGNMCLTCRVGLQAREKNERRARIVNP